MRQLICLLSLAFVSSFWHIFHVHGLPEHVKETPQLCSEYAQNDITLNENHVPKGEKLPVRCSYTPYSSDYSNKDYTLESCRCQHPCSERDNDCGVCSPDKSGEWVWGSKKCGNNEELNLRTCQCEQYVNKGQYSDYPEQYAGDYKEQYAADYKEQYAADYKEQYAADYKDQYASGDYREQYASDYKDQYVGDYKEQYAAGDYKDQYASGDYKEQYPAGDYKDQYAPSDYKDEYASSDYKEQYASDYKDEYASSDYKDEYAPSDYKEQYTSNDYKDEYAPSDYKDSYTPDDKEKKCAENEFYDHQERHCVSRCPKTSVFCIGCTEPKCLLIDNQWKWKCASLCSTPAPAHNCKCIRKTVTNDHRTYTVTQHYDDVCGWQCEGDTPKENYYSVDSYSGYSPSADSYTSYSPSANSYKTYSPSANSYESTEQPSVTNYYSSSSPRNLLGQEMWLPVSTDTDLSFNTNGYNKLFCACVTKQWEHPSSDELKQRTFFKSEYKNANKHCEKVAGNSCRELAASHGASKCSVKAIAVRHSCGGECPVPGKSLGCKRPSIYGCGGRGRMKKCNGNYEDCKTSHLVLDGQDIFSYKCIAP